VNLPAIAWTLGSASRPTWLPAAVASAILNLMNGIAAALTIFLSLSASSACKPAAAVAEAAASSLKVLLSSWKCAASEMSASARQPTKRLEM
jgi:hypothetical protein